VVMIESGRINPRKYTLPKTVELAKIFFEILVISSVK
jgi:hypothetical protein